MSPKKPVPKEIIDEIGCFTGRYHCTSYGFIILVCRLRIVAVIKLRKGSPKWPKNCAHYIFNSFPPSVAYICQWIGSALVGIMAWHLFGAKPLSNQCWANVKWTLRNKLQFWLILIKYKSFHSRKCIWKYHLRNGGHFVSALMCCKSGDYISSSYTSIVLLMQEHVLISIGFYNYNVGYKHFLHNQEEKFGEFLWNNTGYRGLWKALS